MTELTDTEKKMLRERGDALLDRAALRKPIRNHRPVPIRQIIHATEPPMPEIEKKTTYSVEEAAKLTGRSAETIRRHCANGRLKAAGGGRGSTWRISRIELAKWWKQQGGGDLFPEDVRSGIDESIRRMSRALASDEHDEDFKTFVAHMRTLMVNARRGVSDVLNEGNSGNGQSAN